MRGCRPGSGSTFGSHMEGATKDIAAKAAGARAIATPAGGNRYCSCVTVTE